MTEHEFVSGVVRAGRTGWPRDIAEVVALARKPHRQALHHRDRFAPRNANGSRAN